MSDHATTGPYATASTHEEAAVGWVLHTLDRDDEVAFLVHLEDCADCRCTVADVSAAVSSIGGAVAQEEPPARLRDAVMAAVAEEPEPPRRALSIAGSPSRGAAAEPLPDPTAAGGSPGGGTGATVVPMRRRSRPWQLALVAAVAALVVVIGGLVASNRSLTEQRDAQAVESDRVTSMLRDAGRPGVVHATLADPGGGMVGLVVDTGSGPRVLATGLADNRADQTYVLWSLADSTPRPVGTFDVSGSAPSVRSVGSAGGAARPEAYAVSIEPGRTAPTSPTTMVAKGRVGS